jgi:hypothetical protein
MTCLLVRPFPVVSCMRFNNTLFQINQAVFDYLTSQNTVTDLYLYLNFFKASLCTYTICNIMFIQNYFCIKLYVNYTRNSKCVKSCYKKYIAKESAIWPNITTTTKTPAVQPQKLSQISAFREVTTSASIQICNCPNSEWYRSIQGIFRRLLHFVILYNPR